MFRPFVQLSLFFFFATLLCNFFFENTRLLARSFLSPQIKPLFFFSFFFQNVGNRLLFRPIPDWEKPVARPLPPFPFFSALRRPLQTDSACVSPHLLFPWCSGYHIRLTRGRSPVRSRAETDLLPRGLTARIPGFHPGGPGSTPGVGISFFGLVVAIVCLIRLCVVVHMQSMLGDNFSRFPAGEGSLLASLSHLLHITFFPSEFPRFNKMGIQNLS